MRIVVGDDHALVREGLRPCLRQIDPEAEILDAASFTGVLDLLRRDPGIGLAIVEPRMSDMLPLAGIAAVRSACSGHLAVLSSITDPNLIGAMLSKRIDGFIPKRLHMDAVGSALRLILAGETFLPSSLLLGERGPSVTAVSGLTPRESEVMALLRDGLSNKAIARQLALSEVTVKSHLANAFRKLGVQNRVQAVQAWAPLLDTGAAGGFML